MWVVRAPPSFTGPNRTLFVGGAETLRRISLAQSSLQLLMYALRTPSMRRPHQLQSGCEDRAAMFDPWHTRCYTLRCAAARGIQSQPVVQMLYPLPPKSSLITYGRNGGDAPLPLKTLRGWGTG